MLDPAELYQLADPLPQLDRPVLVQALEGFVDAGSAVRLARQHLLTNDAQLVATFDVDVLYDYRARRPLMLFDTDHWESYAAPLLALHAVRDAEGRSMLLLSGPEPDVLWERFVAAVRDLIARLDVRLTVGLNAIPMAVPHTRPSNVIAHASRPELIAGYQPWLGQVQVPASAGHLLELRLGESGHDVVGFAVAVPHYVAQLDYPAAAVTLLEHVSKVSGLTLSLDALVDAARTTRAAIDAQVEDSAEVAQVVRALETQYDAFVAGTGRSLLAEGARLPTADEIAAEFERYLADNGESG